MGPLSQSVTFCDRGDGNPLPCFCLQNWTLFHLLFLLDNFAVIAWVDNTLGAMMLLKAFLSAPKKKYQIISWYMGNINLWFYQWLLFYRSWYLWPLPVPPELLFSPSPRDHSCQCRCLIHYLPFLVYFPIILYQLCIFRSKHPGCFISSISSG